MLNHKNIRTTMCTTNVYQIPLFSGLNILHAREVVTQREMTNLDLLPAWQKGVRSQGWLF